MPGMFDDVIGREAERRQANKGAIQFATPDVDRRAIAIPEHLRLNRPADRSKGERVIPSYDDHPIPECPQFLHLLTLEAGVAPPWRVRVAPLLIARCDKGRGQMGGMARIAQALAPHATIVMTPDGRHPAPMLQLAPAPLPDDPGHMEPKHVIEFNWLDQPGGSALAPVDRPAPSGGLILPGTMDRTTRTIGK